MDTAGIVEEPLNAVVLVVVPGVIFGQHFGVAKGDLPEDDTLLGDRGEGLEEAGVAGEVSCVEPGRAAVAVDQLLESGVAVAELGESDIEVGAE